MDLLFAQVEGSRPQNIPKNVCGGLTWPTEQSLMMSLNGRGGQHNPLPPFCPSLPIRVPPTDGRPLRDTATGYDATLLELLAAVSTCEDLAAIPSMCSYCSEGRVVISQCQDCNQFLCEPCTITHKHLHLSKDHHIMRFAEGPPILQPFSPQSSSPGSSGGGRNGHSPAVSTQPFITCMIHNKEFGLYCRTCKRLGCSECTVRDHASHEVVLIPDQASKSRDENILLLKDAKKGIAAMTDALEKNAKMATLVERRTGQVMNEVRAASQKIKAALEKREKELLSAAEKICLMKCAALQHQRDELLTAHQTLLQNAKMLSDVLEVDAPPLEMVHATECASRELTQVRSAQLHLSPVEDDALVFLAPDPKIYQLINDMTVASSGCAAESFAAGWGKFQARANRVNSFNVFIRDHLRRKREIGRENEMLSCRLIQPAVGGGGGAVNMKVTLEPGGHYVVYYKPEASGPHAVHIKLRGCHINGSPLLVNVSPARDYTNVGTPLLVFGGEGEAEGKLCRPWGICCDTEGNFIVADRSNNRIQIFRPNGTFLRAFGSQGQEPGHFERPAGVAVDHNGRIIVADKDNHRIQIFTMNGQYLLHFGEKGCKNGQFNYPWDVAVNGEGNILVSDTRNHRLQLFTPLGGFIAKFGFDNPAGWKHFDSPRGVCFTKEGQILVTDFNNHRLIVITPDLTDSRCLGEEGNRRVEFLRPQGVTVDDDGRIIVADSRNNRIQVLDADGSFVHQFGTPGTQPGEFDRPSGICLTPDGKIAVIDFGNNRVQVF